MEMSLEMVFGNDTWEKISETDMGNEQFEKNNPERPCSGEAPAGVAALEAWSPMTL